jgi:hypothetical protein
MWRLASSALLGGKDRGKVRAAHSTRDDPHPKALACYGLLVRCWAAPRQRSAEMWLRFVDGRPVSAVTMAFLQWCAQQAQAQGQHAVLLIWDNASWHDSQIVRTWLRQHNRQVTQSGQGVRLIACFLPSKSPWLHPIEPQPSYNRDSADQPQGPGEYHGGASRPSSRRLHAAGGPALPPGRGAAVGDRAARWEPAVCPGLLVHPAPGDPRERERSGDHDHDGWLTSVRAPRHPLESASAA